MDRSQRNVVKLLKAMSEQTFEGFETFCKTCVKITGGDEASGDTSAIAFKMWESQREFARALCDKGEGEIICLKSRQIGVTWIVLAWKLWHALFWKGIEERITSVGQDEANKALRRVKFMLENLPEWCKPTLEISNTTTVKFAETQSWITALPATINAGRGDTLNDILSDEAAFQVYAKQIITSARPALEKRHGKLIVVSTANGVGNYFQECYSKAEKGENGYRAFFFGWRSDPSRTDAWYERMLRKHGPEYMHENYPNTAAEAFLASGRPYFEQSKLGRELELTDAAFHDGFLDGKEFNPSAQGVLRVWIKPDGKPKVIGADVSEGLEDGDFSNAYVEDVETGAEVARIRGKMDVGEYADMLMQVGEWYSSDESPALLVIEANNQGLAVTKHCKDAGYRNLYYEHDLRTGEVRERCGWYTSAGQGGSRGLMLGKMQTDYRMGRIKVRDRECLEEMSLFAHRGPRGKPQAPPGKHDDCVMSRAIAHFVATYEAPPAQDDVVEAEGGDARYWARRDIERMLEKDAQVGNGGLIELGG